MSARRALYASVTLMGNVRVDGDLDPESGESLLTALRAVLDAEARFRGGAEDERTPAQRRADALGEICREWEWLDRSDRPNVGGERPHLTVTVPIETLASRAELPSGAARAAGAARIAGAVRVVSAARPADAARASDPQAAQLDGAEFDHTGPVAAATVAAARVRRGGDACGDGRPVTAARRGTANAGDPAADAAGRDRGRPDVPLPWVQAPATWCDAHHVVHWADGAPTSASNLLLLCRRHHRMVHRSGGFGVELVEGVPVFRRPDGSVLSGRAPPP